jgi:hypothetical protein
MTNGITITQQGIGVDQALDSQRVIDSRWRYFDILYEKKVSLGIIPDWLVDNSDIVLFKHKLGFLPAFDCYNITRGVYMATLSSGDCIYTTPLALDPSNGVDYSNTEVLVRVYSVPITEEYSAPISEVSGKQSPSSKYGVKVLRGDGNSRMNGTELSEYSLNTKGKTLAVQKTGVAVVDNEGLAIIRHNLGFPPTYLTARMEDGGDEIQSLDPDFVPVLSSSRNDDNELVFGGAQGVLTGSFAYVIFKEPAELAI